jgi:hypothetical protein
MPSSPKSQVGRLKALPPRTSRSETQFEKETLRRAKLKAEKINKTILGPGGYEAAKVGLKVGRRVAKGISSTQRASQEVLNKTASYVARDVKDMAQFGSKRAKEVVKDVQGLAKMVMKGFGN